MRSSIHLCIATLGLAILWQGSTALAAFTLVDDGHPKAVIVVGDKASAAAKKGAALLAAQIQRVSGAKLDIFQESGLRDAQVKDSVIHASAKSASPEAFVLVGESALTKQLGAAPEGLGPGGILLRSFPNALVLLGPDDTTPSDPNGTRYAVTTFLEDVLGFRFLWPGELGLVAPPRKTVTVPDLNKSFTPLIGQRQIRSAGYGDRMQAGLDYLGVKKEEYLQHQAAAFGTATQTPGWFEWQRLGGNIGFVGGDAWGYTWEKYHAAHPEWFALQANGSRDLSQLTPERARLCKSNLALIDALAADKIAEINRTHRMAASLAPNDGGKASFCMCPECKKLDAPDGGKIKLWDFTSGTRRNFDYVSLSDRMVWFWNHLAERITTVHPQARLSIYAYSAYTAPPLHEKLHPSLAVAYVGMDYVRESERQESRKEWDGWAQAAKQIYWRPNLLLFARREGTPALYVHKLGEDLHYFAHHSLVGTDFDACMHHWSTQGVNSYVLARLLWNPDASVDAILDDYCQAGFGAASKDVRHYLDRIEALTNQIATQELGITTPYTPEVITELRAILDAADKAAGDDTIRRRIQFMRLGLDFTALQNRAHAVLALSAGKPATAAEKKEVKNIQQEKWLLMRQIQRENTLAVNTAMVAWGSEALFGRFGWSGAKTVPKDVLDADEKGRPVDPPSAPAKAP